MTQQDYYRRCAIFGVAVGFWACSAIVCWILLLGECSGV